jgi:drug/metabolite transporter (DMT)-like permease
MGGADDGNAASHHENGNGEVDPLISRVANDQGVLIPPGTDDTTAAKKRATSRQTNAEDGTHGSPGGGATAAGGGGVPGSRRRVRKVKDGGGSASASSENEDNVQAKCIKYSALFLLVAQMVGLVLLMRYSRTSRSAENEPLYLASTAVFIMEVMKLVLCLGVVWYQTGFRVLHELHHHTIGSPLEILYLCVPSLLYTVQNNLLYLALTNLDAATYQVCYQLKILTTALFSAVLLARKFSAQKWAALVVLTVGVAIVQLSGSDDQHSSGNSSSSSTSTTTDHHEAELELAAAAAAAHQNRLVGLIAVICAACTSGFSGVYFGM